MADGRGPGRITTSGVALCLLLWALVAASLWLFIGQKYWFPPAASEHAAAVDGVFNAVLWAAGIAFVAVQGILGFLILRYGASGDERAEDWHDNHKLELGLTIATTVVLTVLVFMGSRVWADIKFSAAPDGALAVDVIGAQFQWMFHYPGPDGQLGRRDVRFVNSVSNPIGLDQNDPAAQDDLVTINQMHAVSKRAVKVRLISQDVIHSFFLPYHRVKQDAVPGMQIELWFVPTTAGQYEIACAELCGLGHYRMKAFLTIDASQQQFDQWFQEQKAAAAGN